MKKYINGVLFFLLPSVVLIGSYSCKVKSTEPDGAYVGYDYYPLELGRYIVYDVYDTNYTALGRIDSVYQLKEIISGLIQEGNELKYVLHQYFKERSAPHWPSQPDSVWTLVNSSNQLIRTENNISYIKLIFPVKDNITWNGNARNIYDAQLYMMRAVDQTYPVSGLFFNPSLLVQQSNEKSIVNKDVRYEVYARGIGPIKKEYTVYSYDQSQLGQDVVEFGYHKVFLIRDYGPK